VESPAQSKRVTLAQVAELARVSVMTASYTYSRPERVSEQSRSRVLAAAARLGYAGPDPSARSLRRGSTRTIGLVLGEHLTYAFDDPPAVSFLAGVADICAARGYGVTILPTTGAVDDVDRVSDAAVDGFIVWTTADDDPVLAAVRATKRPAVVHGGPAVPGLGLVAIDNQAAARAIGGVVFKDAKRLAVVSQPLDRQRASSIVRGLDPSDALFPVTRHRLEGYRRAAEDTGNDWSDVTVAVCSRNSAAEAEVAATSLLSQSEPPDAIAAMSDVQAAGVARVVRAAGLAIPDDVAISGWDDAAVAARLRLTTVAQSMREQGSECARTALGERQTTKPAPWAVVRRASTRA
jgi:DNA-binding LacI/PurR family transcriptional regulator